jgi:hypothetical protein
MSSLVWAILIWVLNFAISWFNTWGAGILYTVLVLKKAAGTIELKDFNDLKRARVRA